MAIEVVKEPSCFELGDAELCIFCNVPTRYWNEKENKPICESCAEHFKQEDVDKHEY